MLLWEMVRAQWLLFDDREDPLVDALFRLRASSNLIVSAAIHRGGLSSANSRFTNP